ncbi:MAG: helix-turn-helix domain-containing protein [Alphaproteobacteria bacterium]|nr:helix-turn-helix domain-containing protein [Alphaproteobacteria bacterium]
MLELLTRGVAIGVLLAAGLTMLRGGSLNSARWSGALLCLATAGFVAHTSATIPALIGPVRHVAWIFSAGGTAYFWLFAMALFVVPRVRAVHALPIVVMTSIGVVGRLLPPGGGVGTEVVHNLFEVLLVGHVLIEIWRRRGDDLVDERRVMRIPLMAGVALFCIMLSAFDVAWSLGFRDPWVKELQAALLTLMALTGAWAFNQAREAMFERTVERRAIAAPTSARTPVADAADRDQLDRLKKLMDETDFWRQSGLTIGAMAERLGLPEYRLRQVINRGLGYRNFSDFLNERRISVAKIELRDPTKAGDQISTIAFDLGYASLGPFNRAFREATGKSPSEWREGAADS